ncbi:flagellar hook-associated protein FlgK [Desemzia sp. RIT804]|uniref:flagellar hook-associated protein FlgK n=1 Tax=Desemzia sp. RIT 804 TaxID=2810209 RepID=UPI0019521311|nr:flagellar hook-associated protein FlgK [Desemzia sp. RIT 804]MBM6614712.1 flagellar hook-associated protein FlgK [Desemzia sp. RIT 804]
MSGLFGSLNSATSGMNAAQTVLQTISHNVANANTDGYSKQKVTMETNNPFNKSGVGQLGTGVRISGIIRIVDDAVVEQLRNENSSLEMFETKSDALAQLESIFNEPSTTGLSNNLSEVFASWTYLGSNPEVATAKTMVVQNSETMTDTLNHMASQLEKLQNSTSKNIEQDVKNFNTKLEQLNSLNKQISYSISSGQTPNDLLDKQDALLNEMSGIAGIEVEFDEMRQATVSIGDQVLLNPTSMQKLAVAKEPNSEGTIVLAGDETKVIELTSGSAKGSQDALAEINKQVDSLNEFAYTFATAVNTIHSGGDENGEAFFDLGTDTNYAKNISVKAELVKNPEKVNSGKSLTEPAAGDGSRAQAIADLQNTKLVYSSEATFEYDETTMTIKDQANGTSVVNGYNDIVTEIGISKQQSDNMFSSQKDLVQLLEQRQQSISGVSINEEVTNMIQHQSAFQANSRMISVISEMLDTLINRTGV